MQNLNTTGLTIDGFDIDNACISKRKGGFIWKIDCLNSLGYKSPTIYKTEEEAIISLVKRCCDKTHLRKKYEKFFGEEKI